MQPSSPGGLAERPRDHRDRGESHGGSSQTCDVQAQPDEPVCELTYPRGTSVTLTATAASGRTFAGWSAYECPGTRPCTLTLDDLVSIVPRFTPFRLVVLSEGAGAVSRSPAGAGCQGEDPCTATYAPGTEVVLTATPAPVEWGLDSWCEPDGASTRARSAASRSTSTRCTSPWASTGVPADRPLLRRGDGQGVARGNRAGPGNRARPRLSGRLRHRLARIREPRLARRQGGRGVPVRRLARGR